MKLNEHIKDFLGYYETLANPRFAVLVTGEWGTGKTHVIGKLLPWKGENPKSYYISLFGLKTPEDIIASVYAEMYPTRAKIEKNSSKTADSLKGASLFGFPIGSLGSLANSYLTGLLRKEVDKSKVLIFDDLERSVVDEKTLLGLINFYVEHCECRVVVIAHDEKLVDSVRESKEKIFGQTLKVKPEVADAFDSFILEISDKNTREKILPYKTLICDVFSQSGSSSLRVLRHLVLDVSRLYPLLDDQHLASELAVRDLLLLFSALDIEVRQSRFFEKDLRARGTSRLGMRNNAESIYGAAQKKYQNVDLSNTILDDDVLVQMLIFGSFDKDLIRNSLNKSPYFTAIKDMDPWKKVMLFESLDDDVVSDAITALLRQFKEYKLVSAGEILHMVSLLMMLSKHGEIEESLEDVERESFSYVDHLLASKSFVVDPNFDFTDRVFGGGAFGFAYWVEDSYSENFRRVVRHLKQQMKEALNISLGDAVDELLGLLTSHPRQFGAAVSFTGDGDHKFARLPVLKSIDPIKFVDGLLGAQRSGEGLYWVKTALESRYDGGILRQDGELASELGWIKSVLKILDDKISASRGLSRFRIERLVPKINLPPDPSRQTDRPDLAASE